MKVNKTKKYRNKKYNKSKSIKNKNYKKSKKYKHHAKNSKKYSKKNRNIKRKEILGGANNDTIEGNSVENHLNLPVDLDRFTFKIITNELTHKNIPSEYNVLRIFSLFVIDNKKQTKNIISDIDLSYKFYVFLFDTNKPYVYYIDLEDINNKFKPINNISEITKLLVSDKKMEKIKQLLINDTIDINEKIDEIDEYDANIVLINLTKEQKQHFNFDAEEVTILLNHLNSKLKEKCPNLELKLEYLSEHSDTLSVFSTHDNDLTLCLYHNNMCISSITLSPTRWPPIIEDYEDSDDEDIHRGVSIEDSEKIMNALEISSRTHPLYDRRKFNKLLRATVIILSNVLTNNKNKIKYIVSEAINPISAWLLIKYYDVDFDDEFKNYLKSNKMNISDITQDVLKQYMKNERSMINITIEINSPNVEKAYEEFNNLTNVSIERDNVLNCSNMENIRANIKPYIMN